MSFFSQAEIDILNNYKLNDTILAKDYLADFVLKNPLNYPFSSTIMRHGNHDETIEKISDYYTKENIHYALSQICIGKQYSSSISTYMDMIHLQKISFTGLMLIICAEYNKTNFIIHQKEPDIIISISNSSDKYKVIIDKSFTSILLYDGSNGIFLNQVFNQHKSSVAEISNESKKLFDHYYFEFIDCDEDIKNQVIALSFLTNNTPPKWFMDITESCKYQAAKSIMRDYSIFKLASSAFECLEDARVKKIEDNSNKHLENVITLDILNHKV